ncbi:MAG: outer-membrane lipoprotein carrier protein LolA, partial [Gammaproteobacteria bacterium]
MPNSEGYTKVIPSPWERSGGGVALRISQPPSQPSPCQGEGVVDLKKPYCLIVWLLVCASPAGVWGKGRDSLDSFLRQFKTLTAKFEQTLLSEQGQQLEASRGQVYLQRPGLFRWDYFAPYQQSIVADGERVWVYD